LAAHSKKVNFAKEQLEDAILLYLDGRYISAITLLGAAREIFSTAIEKKTGHNIDDRQWELMNKIRTNVGTPHISKRALLKMDRQLYNSVKHYNIDESETLHINRRYEAFPMLYHTFNLALYLDINFKNKAKFKKYLKENFESYPAEVCDS